MDPIDRFRRPPSRPQVHVRRTRADERAEAIDISPAKLAAEMANAFTEELDQLLQRLALQEAKSRLVFLEKERSQASASAVLQAIEGTEGTQEAAWSEGKCSVNMER